MTGKADDPARGSGDDGKPSAPRRPGTRPSSPSREGASNTARFGRNRVDSASAAGRAPLGPRFDGIPPRHPLLLEMHSMWIEATADDIRGVVTRAREMASGAPEEIAEWAVRYVEALERLEFWLRDF